MSDAIELQKIVGEVAAAYFSHNHVSPAEIPAVINQIAGSLSAVGAPPLEAPVQAPETPKLTPAEIRKSITPQALISFEDNKPYKTMRRHLASRGLSPDEYRAKWGLPKDYPMVSPSYSQARSAMAKSRGFGSRLTAAKATPVAVAEKVAPKRQVKARRAVGRPRKSKTPTAAAE